MKSVKLSVLALATLCFSADWCLITNVSATEDNLPETAVSARAFSSSSSMSEKEKQSEKAIFAQEQLARLHVPYSDEAFVSSAARGDERVVSLFLDSGLSLNARNQDGFTALMWSTG